MYKRKRKRNVPAGATVRGVGAIPYLDDTDHPLFGLAAQYNEDIRQSERDQYYEKQDKLLRAEITAIFETCVNKPRYRCLRVEENVQPMLFPLFLTTGFPNYKGFGQQTNTMNRSGGRTATSHCAKPATNSALQLVDSCPTKNGVS